MIKPKLWAKHGLRKKIAVCALAAVFALSFMALPAQAFESSLTHDMQIPAARSFRVYVAVDGRTIPVMATWGFSVQNVLDRAGVVLGEEDTLSHFTHRPVRPDETIRVERRVRDTVTRREAVPYQTVQVPSSLWPAGRQYVVGNGRDGVREITYSRLLVNGVVVEREQIGEAMIYHPVNRRLLVGTPGARISPFDFEWERCEDGRPINYVTRLTEQRATAYCNSVGYITSTGQRAAVGLVAVDPRVIPYGTLMYIATPCRTFVYGYAIAADTGGDLRRGRIDVDLFLESRFETYHHGRRTVDIYILRLPS